MLLDIRGRDTLCADYELLPDSSVVFHVEGNDFLIAQLPLDDRTRWAVMLDGKNLKLDFSGEKPVMEKGSKGQRTHVGGDAASQGVGGSREAGYHEYFPGTAVSSSRLGGESMRESFNRVRANLHRLLQSGHRREQR